MLATLGAAVLTVLASLTVGAAILKVSGRRDAKLAAGVGFAALVLAAVVLVRLPGHGKTALVGLVLITLVAAWLVRDWLSPRRGWAVPAASAAVLVPLLALPFLAAGHFGPLGASLDDDLGFHLGWVYSLAHGPPPFSFFSLGYPLGGESLAATLTSLGLGDQPALLGVTAAGLGLTAITASRALERLPWWLRIPAAAACGLPVLSAGFFGEASIKEPLTGLLVLTLALLSVDASIRDIPAGLLLAGCSFFIFGSAGLGWPVAFLLVAVFCQRWRRPRAVAGAARQAAIGVGVALLALGGLVLLPKAVPRLGVIGFKIYLGGVPAGHFGGNLTRQIPLTEGLGVWFGHDFRLGLPGGPLASLAVALAVVLLVAAVLGSLRRWRTSLLAQVVAVVVLHLVARLTTAAYFSLKLMVAGGPLILLFIVLGVTRLASEHRRPSAWPGARAAACAAVLAFALCVAWSDIGVLRSSPVGPTTFGAELESFRPIIGTHQVFFLGDDQWVPEWLRGAAVDAFRGVRSFPTQQLKTPVPPFDFDTPIPQMLAGASYVVAPRTLTGSVPPANWKLIRTTAHFELFAQVKTAPPRAILDERRAPGARLECALPSDRKLAAQRGVAGVRPPPITSSIWLSAAGQVEIGSDGGSLLGSGATAFATIRLPRGEYQLSLSYQSATAITVTAPQGISLHLQPTLAFFGPLYAAGVVTSPGGVIRMRATVATGYAPIPLHGAQIGAVWAIRVPLRERIVPLRAACGKYVDWYRVNGA